MQFHFRIKPSFALPLLSGLLTAGTAVCEAADVSRDAPAVFSDEFRTLTAAIDGNRLAPPVLTLGSDDRLTIGFDGMGDERRYLRYSICLCDADWSTSELIDSEVFDGFNYADITDYSFSRATTAHYVHYSITLPNSDFSFRLSGNYLLWVYPEENPDDILLQFPFMVQEKSVSVSGTITTRTDVDYNDSHQQLALDIDTRNANVRNPSTDLRVVVRQNYRRDNAVELLHPTRLRGSVAIYEHNPLLIFDAGNEYRRMETVSNLYPGMGEDHIEFHAPFYHHILNTDSPRAERQYRYDQTQQGRFFIREYNAADSDTEADYPLVLFTLDMLPLPDTDIYLDGDFMHRRFDDASRMDYNPAEGRYEKLIPLKQGAYNYRYLALPASLRDQDSSPLLTPRSVPVPLPSATAPVEGDHYQTVNEYSVAVYYRAPGERHDRLLGFTTLFSGQ